MTQPDAGPATVPDSDAAARAALVALVRDEGARVLATLIRITGDVDLAQDCVQDATLRALATWPRDGVPDLPRAWLVAAARRRAIDVVRRERSRAAKEALAMEPPEPAAAGWGDDPARTLERRWELEADDVVPDDLLRLVFTCCHPSLSLDTQIALTLRTLCGLTTAQVARALVIPEATAAKRLTRAKQKIARARIPYRVPASHELTDRLPAVAACVYLMFNEGYAATGGDDPIRAELLDEAVRLGRLLTSLMPGEPPLLGLLALMLLHDARRESRLDEAGEVVLLPDQDRSRWDGERIREGVVLVGEGLRRSPDRPDPYVVQAAIAACHALAPHWEATDWGAVLSWYDVLLTVQDTPVVRLNRAVAVGELDGAAAGLAAVEAVDGLEGYAPWHGCRGELLHRLGRPAEAADAYRRALARDPSPGIRRHLERRLAGLTA